MDKDLIKLLISEYQRSLSSIELVERPFVMDDSLNYVLVGLRRAGKSYMMYQQIRHLLKIGHAIEEILYFNFEDDRINGIQLTDLDLIKVCYEEMYNHRPIFFLDEIQIVDGWEKFARRLADRKYSVCITGSNAKMLSSEVATTLGGRYMIKHVFPYSFIEYLLSCQIDFNSKNTIYKRRKEIIKCFEHYFTYGGLPELNNVSNKREWLSNLYQKVFFGDVVTRYGIRNDFALRVLVRKLAESVKQPSSFNRIANIVSASGKKISTDTVIDYIRHLQDSWLIFAVENICAKLADKESSKKYYFIDNGLLNLFLIDPNTFLLENQVAIQLYRLYSSGFYYYNQGVEVDFYVPERNLAIQVCYSISDLETRKREVNGLLQLSKRLEVRDMLIITKDEEDLIIAEDGSSIKVVPVWKWLFGAV